MDELLLLKVNNVFYHIEKFFQKVIYSSFLKLAVSGGLALILEAKYIYTNDISLVSGDLDTSRTALDDKMKRLEDLDIQLSNLSGCFSSSGHQIKLIEQNIPDQNEIQATNKGIAHTNLEVE